MADDIKPWEEEYHDAPKPWEEAAQASSAPAAAPEEEPGLLKSIGQGVGAVASGAIAQPLAGLAGLGSLLVPGVDSGAVVNKVQNALTYKPTSTSTQKALMIAALPFEKLAQGSEYLGGVAGGDLGAAIGRTVGEIAPMVIPGGKIIGGAAKGLEPELMALRARAAAMRDVGYKIPPTMAGDKSFLANLTQGAGGKIKTQQEASIANQGITNNLVKKDLGIPDDEQITPELLSQLRRDAGQHYEAIKNLPVKFNAPDEYIDSVSAIGQEAAKLGEAFPNSTTVHVGVKNLISDLAQPNFDPSAVVNKIKQLRADSKANKKNFQDPEKLQLGDAQKKGADLLEGLIDSNLQGMQDMITTNRVPKGSALNNLSSEDVGQLLGNFRNARTKIAAIHSAEDALNESTGNVSAHKLGAMLDRGVPLSGGMKTAAQFARGFRGAAQSPEMIGGVPHISPLDLAGSALGGVAGGLMAGPYGSIGLMAPALRPAARALVLSKAYQQGVLPSAITKPAGALTQTAPFAVSGLNKQNP